MKVIDLHRAQASILYDLRHKQAARFSELMAQTTLTSDSFKFHLSKLVKLGLVNKRGDGRYELSRVGKEFANDLSESRHDIQKRPKLSMLLVVKEVDPAGNERFLFQRRLRQPFYGYWGLISGPIPWGVEIEVAASHELKKQTDLEADFKVRGFRRQRDYEAVSGELLEDKLFAILIASNVRGDLKTDWPHGENEWLTPAELNSRRPIFSVTEAVIKPTKNGQTYTSATRHMPISDY